MRKLVADMAVTEEATQAAKEAAGMNSGEVKGKAAELQGEAKGTANEMSGKASELAGQAKGKVSYLYMDGGERNAERV